MATPNEMPKKNPSELRQRILANLIEHKKQNAKRKSFRTNSEGSEELVTEDVEQTVLRYPLAQNVSENTVQRAAERWL